MGIHKKEITPELLLTSVKERMGVVSYELIKRAYETAAKYHEGQKRHSGEPYVIHPVNVAYILYDLNQDDMTISAGLLHDVIEDTEYTREQMIAEFGKEITHLVEGVTKISKYKNKSKMSKEATTAENLKKMLIAITKDPRIIIIKLADKTHNMRTLKFHKPEKQKVIAEEVLNIYAPLAGRFGIYRIKSELEDLAFQILNEGNYDDIKSQVSATKSERDKKIEIIKGMIRARLQDINIDAKVFGRAKHFYSIYKKMEDKNKTFKEIFDLLAVRVIVPEVRDCYGVLGIIHTLWSPIPGRFKDYIATPKSNQYQSLHTAVIDREGQPIEFQIRTEAMNQTAEYGIAAHWSYKEGRTANPEMNQKWQEMIKSWSESSSESKEFLEELSHELHEDEVFVFTPRGDIYNFPKGSTILDYAFRIHTDVGLTAKAAKIAGRMVPLRTELVSGDQIEIITDRKIKPSPIWLRIVKTAVAKQKLRQYFRKIQEEAGTVDSNSFIPIVTNANIKASEMAAAPAAPVETVPSGKLKTDKKKEKQEKTTAKRGEVSVVVAGIKDILVRLAGCCSPLPGDEIVGFITRGRGVSVHKSNCEIAKTHTDKKRLVAVRWDGVNNPVPVRIEVKAYDRQGIYLEMVECISKTETNILEAGATSAGEGTLIARFLIEIEHHDQLQEILDNIRAIRNILYAERVLDK